jgi:glycosyltransferase involved in cell wall biosynthesis
MTVGFAIDSIRSQSYPVDEVFVIDDGSSDGSEKVAETKGVKLIRHSRNMGRGAVRAEAMKEATHEFVLSCDASKALEPDFVKKALVWLEDPKVAAVFGYIIKPNPVNTAERWQNRHTFKEDIKFDLKHNTLLITAGCLVRKSVVTEAGNYNPLLRHSEDADLGERLLACGYDVIFDPRIKIISKTTSTLWQALEQYWRWYAGKEERVNFKRYLKQIIYSFKSMAAEDIRRKDLMSVFISIFSPHYQFWKSLYQRHKKTILKTN